MFFKIKNISSGYKNISFTLSGLVDKINISFLFKKLRKISFCMQSNIKISFFFGGKKNIFEKR